MKIKRITILPDTFIAIGDKVLGKKVAEIEYEYRSLGVVDIFTMVACNIKHHLFVSIRSRVSNLMVSPFGISLQESYFLF